MAGTNALGGYVTAQTVTWTVSSTVAEVVGSTLATIYVPNKATILDVILEVMTLADDGATLALDVGDSSGPETADDNRFIAAFSGNPYEQFVFINRAFGPMNWAYWTMVVCNVVIPQVLWFRQVRRCIPLVFVISIFVNIGMWFERFVIIVTSLHRDFLPSSWADYTPTLSEIATFVGSFGLFFSCFLLFCRIAPAIAIAEIKGAAHLPKPTRVESTIEEKVA